MAGAGGNRSLVNRRFTARRNFRFFWHAIVTAYEVRQERLPGAASAAEPDGGAGPPIGGIIDPTALLTPELHQLIRTIIFRQTGAGG
jgi:hypothetical protein